MIRLRKLLDRGIETFGCALLLVMVAIACWQVISRYIFNSPSTFYEEFLRFALVWMSVIGLAYVAGKHQHISLTLLLDKSPVQLARLWDIVIQIVFILFAIYILIIGGWHVSSNAMLQISPALHISMGKVYYVLPIGGILTIIYCVLNIFDILHCMRHTAATGEVHHG